MCLSLIGIAQESAEVAVIDSAFARLARVVYYEADATIEVNVDFIRMPVKTAHFAFQAPDSFRMDSDGFLMIPKVGMKPLTQQLDRNRYQPVPRGNEVVKGKEYQVYNMIPLDRNDEVVLSTLWIDPEAFHVARVETFTKKNGSYTIDMEYKDEVLPSSIVISFEIEGMNIPLKYFGADVEVDKPEVNTQEVSTGTVRVVFENYQVRFR